MAAGLVRERGLGGRVMVFFEVAVRARRLSAAKGMNAWPSWQKG